MSDLDIGLEPVPLDHSKTSGIKLALWHYTGAPSESPTTVRKPVLLVHGASGNHRTFMVGGFARWLSSQRFFDPWLLDWRASSLVAADPANEGTRRDTPEAYNFNLAAQQDIPLAIATVREATKTERIAALGFCMGGAILAEAVATASITAADVDCLVLMTMGLFYETPIDGRLKVEDRVLEHLGQLEGKERVLTVDPRVSQKAAWNAELEDMYQRWPAALKKHAPPDPTIGKGLDPVDDMCNRLSFIYGTPYHHPNLPDDIHGTPSKRALLPELFGAIPLQLLIHGARNIRHRRATVYGGGNAGEEIVTDAARDRFRGLEKVTLITGALNLLWHRDSIDLMHEWLTRGNANHLGRFTKHVLPGYGHQDLLWGRGSPGEVFDKIEKGLSVG